MNRNLNDLVYLYYPCEYVKQKQQSHFEGVVNDVKSTFISFIQLLVYSDTLVFTFSTQTTTAGSLVNALLQKSTAALSFHPFLQVAT